MIYKNTLNMKKLFTFVAAASIFAACTSKSDLATQKDVIAVDTASMYRSNASTDVNPADVAKPAAPAVAPTTIIRERVVYVDRTPRARRQTIREADPIAPAVSSVPQAQPQAGTAPSTTQSSGVGTAPSEGTGSSTASVPETVEKKKGWSNAAKDAAIGGVGGAVVGAVLSKKKGKGAVIGGILGGVGGYILGKKKDKSQANDLPNYVSY